MSRTCYLVHPCLQYLQQFFITWSLPLKWTKLANLWWWAAFQTISLKAYSASSRRCAGGTSKTTEEDDVMDDASRSVALRCLPARGNYFSGLFLILRDVKSFTLLSPSNHSPLYRRHDGDSAENSWHPLNVRCPFGFPRNSVKNRTRWKFERKCWLI